MSRSTASASSLWLMNSGIIWSTRERISSTGSLFSMRDWYWVPIWPERHLRYSWPQLTRLSFEPWRQYVRQSGLSSSEATMPSTETKSAKFFCQNLVNTVKEMLQLLFKICRLVYTYLVVTINLQFVNFNDALVVWREEFEGLWHWGHAWGGTCNFCLELLQSVVPLSCVSVWKPLDQNLKFLLQHLIFFALLI